MPKITDIKPQRNGKRLNIYLDGKFAFGIDLNNYVKYGLKKDLEIESIEIEKIIKKSEWQKVFDRLLAFVTIRPRSEKEISDWLKRKKAPESLYEEMITKLRKMLLVDDEKFAAWWVEQRQTFKPKPSRVLRNELKIKGINEEIIKSVLGKTEIDEVQLGITYLKKRSYKWKNLEPREKKDKMLHYLASKGLEWDAAKKAVQKAIEEGID